MSFEREWEAALTKIDKINDKVVQDSANELFGKIVDNTPVGDPSQWQTKRAPSNYRPGKLKANWQASVGTSKTTKLEGNRDVSGSSTKGQIKSALSSFKTNLTAYLSNNQPYAGKVEDGYSKQAPAGMVKRALLSWQDIINKHSKGR